MTLGVPANVSPYGLRGQLIEVVGDQIRLHITQANFDNRLDPERQALRHRNITTGIAGHVSIDHVPHGQLASIRYGLQGPYHGGRRRTSRCLIHRSKLRR